MRKLLVYMKDYKKESFLAPLFKLLEATFELIVPLVIAQIIDVGIQTGDTGFIISRCLLLVGFGVVGMVSAITAQYFAAKAAVGFATGLRHSLFQKINGLSFSLLDRVGTSTLLTRITNDVNQVQNGVNGLRQITAQRVYNTDGIQLSQKILSTEVVQEPVTEKIVKGTKKVTSSTSYILSLIHI